MRAPVRARRLNGWFFLLWSTRSECDNMISALKLVTTLIKGDRLGVEAESWKERHAEALATFISLENARAFNTLGELA